MFYLGGVGLSFFLTLLLLSKRGRNLADNTLAIWLLVITAHLLFFYFRKEWLYPQLLGFEMPIPLLHGPLLYLYTRALTNRPHSWKIALLHFAPALIVIAFLIPFFAMPMEDRLFVYRNGGVGYETFNLLKTIAIIVSGIVYVLLSMVALRRHRISIANQFSFTEKINLQWLQYLIYGIAVIWLMVIFANDDWVFAMAVLFVFLIGFFGIRQGGIFQETHRVEPSPKPVVEAEITLETATSVAIAQEKRKYQKSGLTPDGSEELHQKLKQMMEAEKLFCEAELSLADLADRLNTQPNYLSQVINEREGKNFYDYVNTLRIEEFKKMVSEPDNRKYTLLALAQQCGFNSKSSFNRYFKRMTGQSPSEYVGEGAEALK
jgi:AraC-like DNA-binding protein